jgi:hypothetical protein
LAMLAGCATAPETTVAVHASEKNRFEVVDCMIEYWPVAGPRIESTDDSDVLTSEAGVGATGLSARTTDSGGGSVTELRKPNSPTSDLTVLDQCF